MLCSTTVFAGDGVAVDDVACHHGVGRGRAIEPAAGTTLVLVRRGCFVRSVSGVDRVLDPTLAYATNPGEEQRFDHPYPHGDDCTVVSLAPELAASLWGGDPGLPGDVLSVGAQLDLAHRTLLARAARGDDAHGLFEHAVAVCTGLLEAVDPRRVASGRPATARRRRVLVDEARQALAADHDVSLRELAQRLHVSPYHLSRTFRAITGTTVARQRMRLRVRGALERLAGGERDIARVAADAGFADQSHLWRVAREEIGVTPGELRVVLGR